VQYSDRPGRSWTSCEVGALDRLARVLRGVIDCVPAGAGEGGCGLAIGRWARRVGAR